MVTEIEKRHQERKIIKKETRSTIFISMALIFLTGVYAFIGSIIKTDPAFERELLEKIFNIVNLFVIILLIVILAIRKTVYYSPRFIKEDFTLIQVLQKWRSMDIILLAAAEIIPIIGLVMRIMGMPMERSWHFFVAGGILMILIMPVGIKVRSKLGILRKTHPDI